MNNNNAKEVLRRLQHFIEVGQTIKIRDHYNALSIFDWWTENLSVSKMKQMEAFLKNAIRLGYNGYVCFKVGAHQCSNGMWAYKEVSKDGYAPESDALYRSFSPDYTYYQFSKNGIWYPIRDKYDSYKTIKELEKLMKEVG